MNTIKVYLTPDQASLIDIALTNFLMDWQQDGRRRERDLWMQIDAKILKAARRAGWTKQTGRAA